MINIRMATKILQYPENLYENSSNSQTATYIMFRPYEWTSDPTRIAQDIKNKQDVVREAKAVANICLYHPEQMQTTTNVQWSDETTGFGDVLYEAFRNVFHGHLPDTNVRAQIERGLLGGTTAAKVAKDKGRIVNPNLEVFFTGIGTREFSFNFTFSPSSQEEARVVADIIKTFKKYAAPKMSSKGGYLAFPSYWEISEVSKGVSLHHFKSSVLTSVSVDAAPHSMWSTFDDGFPTTTSLSLTFKELDIVTQQDYDDLQDKTTFGY